MPIISKKKRFSPFMGFLLKIYLCVYLMCDCCSLLLLSICCKLLMITWRKINNVLIDLILFKLNKNWFTPSLSVILVISTNMTSRKIFQVSLWWPNSHKYCREKVKKCDKCQRISRLLWKNEISLHLVRPSLSFEIWDIYFLGHFPKKT